MVGTVSPMLTPINAQMVAKVKSGNRILASLGRILRIWTALRMRDDPGFLPQNTFRLEMHSEKTQVARLSAGSFLTRPAPRTPDDDLLHSG